MAVKKFDPSIVVPLGKIRVPNSGKDGADILIVGEAPGFEEEQSGLPFFGPSGQLLWNALGREGISRENVKVANLCQYRPQKNNFKQLLQTKALTDGIAELVGYIKKYPPKVVLALGHYPTQYLTGRAPIGNYRGSILPCIFDANVKVIPSFHPSFILRTPSHYPTFSADIERAVSDSKFSEFKLPVHSFHYALDGERLEQLVQKFEQADILTVDIETRKKDGALLCVGFGMKDESGVVSLCIQPASMQHTQAIFRLLLCQAKKVFHNGGAFDIPMLERHGFKVENFHWDTMIAHRIVWAELPSSLAFLTSLYTREPYYKDEGKQSLSEEEGVSQDTKAWGDKIPLEKLYIYNCKDVHVTYDIYLAQQLEVCSDKNYSKVFNFEMGQLEVAASISKAGLPVDDVRLKQMKNSLLFKWLQLQQQLNKLVGYSVNVNSPTQKKELLYTKLGLPERKIFAGGVSRVTTNEDALVASIGFCKDKINELKTEDGKNRWEDKIKAIRLIMQIVEIRKLLSSYILAKRSPDGKLRSTFKVMATETGRWGAAKYIDGTGINAQTAPRESIELVEAGVELSEDMVKTITADSDEDDDE